MFDHGPPLVSPHSSPTIARTHAYSLHVNQNPRTPPDRLFWGPGSVLIYFASPRLGCIPSPVPKQTSLWMRGLSSQLVRVPHPPGAAGNLKNHPKLAFMLRETPSHRPSARPCHARSPSILCETQRLMEGINGGRWMYGIYLGIISSCHLPTRSRTICCFVAPHITWSRNGPEIFLRPAGFARGV